MPSSPFPFLARFVIVRMYVCTICTFRLKRESLCVLRTACAQKRGGSVPFGKGSFFPRHAAFSATTTCVLKTGQKQGRLLEQDGGGGGGGTAAASALLLGEGGGGAGEPPPPPIVYSIRSGDHRIGSFILHKAEFCAGDIVLGNFDFSEASTRCLQVRESAASWFGLVFLSLD